MMTVKVRRSLFATEYGAVRSGDVVQVSETAGRQLIQRGLAEAAEGAAEAKDAPTPRNQMAPPPKTKTPPKPERPSKATRKK